MITELKQEAPASENRHSRKCTICNHPDREAIDEAFLHWSSSERIVRDYSLPSISCLYRHAHARGLWLQRRGKIRFALDLIIEQAGECRASANAILRAIEISCRFDKDNHYVEPQKRVIVEHHTVNPNQETRNDSNRESQKLETPATPTKQTSGRQSNREESRGGGSPPSRVSTGCSRNPTQPTQLPFDTQTQIGRVATPPPYNSKVATEQNPNRESQQLETAITPTKQTPEPQSNRELEAVLSATPNSVFTSAIQDMLLGRAPR